jgi:cytochrome c1
MRRVPATFTLAAMLLGAAVLAACGSSIPATSALAGADRDRAPSLIRQYGCGSCHSIAGVDGADGLVGPSLGGFGERRTIAGRLPNTPRNLTRWLLDPQQIKPGDVMPDVGLSTREARDIAAYLDGGS